MFSAVPKEHGTTPSSASLRPALTGYTSDAGARTYCANAPSKSEPSQSVSGEEKPCGRMQGLTRTRRPSSVASPPGPTSSARPQQSVPWMKGNGEGALQPPASYQPTRVLTSVALTPAARTRTSTSPSSGRGRRTSRTSSVSNPPFPVVTTASIASSPGRMSNRLGSRPAWRRITSSTDVTAPPSRPAGPAPAEGR